MALLKDMKPRLPVGSRRITITITLMPESLDVLDAVCVERRVARGRIVDDLIARLRRPQSKGEGGRAAS